MAVLRAKVNAELAGIDLKKYCNGDVGKIFISLEIEFLLVY